MNYKILVKTKSKKYSIFIGKDIILKTKNFFIKEGINYNKCLLVIDKKIPKKIIKKTKKIF